MRVSGAGGRHHKMIQQLVSLLTYVRTAKIGVTGSAMVRAPTSRGSIMKNVSAPSRHNRGGDRWRVIDQALVAPAQGNPSSLHRSLVVLLPFLVLLAELRQTQLKVNPYCRINAN